MRKPHPFPWIYFSIVVMSAVLVSGTVPASTAPAEKSGTLLSIHPFSGETTKAVCGGAMERGRSVSSSDRPGHPVPARIDAVANRRTIWSDSVEKRAGVVPFEDVDLTAETEESSARPIAKGDPRTASLVRELTNLLDDAGGDTDIGQFSIAHRSNPNGRDAPWTTDHLLADATNMNDEYISIAASPVSNNLYAVFEATDLGGTDRDIHIARSTDNGATWDVWEMPSFSQDEYHPELAIDAGGYLLVTWIREDGYILRSKTANPDDPLLWSWVKGLNVGEPCATPAIAVKRQGSNGKVFIAAAWNTINYDLLAYEWTLIWMYSTDGGETVAFDYFLPDGYNDYWPDVALMGSTCYFINAEQDYYSGEVEVVVAVDDISGGFVNPVSLTGWTAMDCRFPVIANSVENVYMAFQLDYDDGLGNVDGDIMYCYSWDGLNEIYGPFSIVADEYESIGPALYAKDGIVGCLWLDAPPGGDEFYLAARQAGGNGHSDYWGDIEIVTDVSYVNPTFHSAFGLVAGDSLHAAWIDRRDYPTQGLNVYTCERSMESNLAPFTPVGWGAPLAASMVEGERTTGWLAANDTSYISFAFVNGGLTDIAADFSVRLMMDGSPVESWLVEGGLEVSAYVTVEDYPIVADEGSHIIDFRIDHLNEVEEMDETDNTYADTLNFIDGDPALRFNPDHITHNYDEPVLKREGAMRIAQNPPVKQMVRMDVVDPRLADAMQTGGAREMMRVVIVPSVRVDAAAISLLLADAGKRDRRDAVSAALKIQSERNRTLLDGAWSELISRGCMSEPEPLWLPGMFTTEMNNEAIEKLAENSNVARLWLDDLLLEPRAFHTSADADASATPPGVRMNRAAAWHIAKTGANSAWSQGYDGSGILIGHLDSGVAYDHPDLASHLWDGSPAYPNHGYDTVDDDNDPYDGDTEWYHGTHTAGLIVGDGTGGTVTGVSPGAELMILRCMPGYYADLVEALQIALDNDVDLLSMSAGWMNPPSDLREGNRYNAEILLTAGIPWVCAGGNGDNMGGHYAVPIDIASPGDCPNPWYGSAGHSSVIAVGALTSTNAVWSGSSYGPTEWNISPSPEGYNDYPYTPGLMKPDVAAPGANVTSTIPSSGYVSYDGTSMATPQVAGACAILMQASPGVLPEELAEALEEGALDLTVSPASPGRDNYTGAGLINIPATLDLLPTSDKEFFYVCNDGVLPLLIDNIAWTESWLQITPLDGSINPGDSLQFTARIDPDGLDWGVHTDYALFTTNDPISPNALPVTVTIGEETSVLSATPPALPGAGLSNLPNPFNPQTAVRFDNPRRGRVTLSIYSSNGRLVRRLVNGVLDPGGHEVVWDGRDDRGRGLASGVYLARLEISGSRTISRKMMLLR